MAEYPALFSYTIALGIIFVFTMPFICSLLHINMNAALIPPVASGYIVYVMLGYVLTVIGFCPKAVINTPWTTPPILHGFLTTGANIMGAVSQAIAIVASILIYAPFLIAYERYQNKQAAEAAE